MSDRIHENRMRRMAQRQGLRLKSSRRRDPLALDYDGHGLVDEETGRVVFGADRAGRLIASLDEVERCLKEGLAHRRNAG